MMTKTRVKHVMTLCMTLLFALLSILSVFASAAETSGSLTVAYPLEETTFTLYKVGSLDRNGEIQLDDQYAAKSVMAAREDQASALATLIADSQLPADQTANISNGTVSFEGLDEGVYLVLGATQTLEEEDGDFAYEVQPALVSLPLWEETDGKKTINWAPTATVKYSRIMVRSAEEREEATKKTTTTTTTTTTTKTDTDSEIPRTGQNWRAVLALAVGGLLLLVLGQLVRKKELPQR